jgi:hypothetical protein
MLGKLESYLQSEKIPFFWDKRSNLIGHLNQAEIKNMCGRVTRLKQKLERALSQPDQDPTPVLNKIFTL